jgi:hypothetical protein
LWWFTGGAKYILIKCFSLLQEGNANLAPGVWLQNIFVPMYGQYDIQGRIISFILRLVQIIARSLALLIWLIFCLALFFCWLILPVVVILGLTNLFI